MGILSIILSIISVIAGISIPIVEASQNKKSIQDTNDTNLQIARETNEANVEQAELAYRRSLPINQVQQLVNAGMSKQGALASLSGGGSYTAPTLQAGHVDAPQMDLSSMSAAFERLNNIPSNVEQNQLVHTQRMALEQDVKNKMNQDRREQEKHEFDMWRNKYDKNTALMLDSASTKVANTLLDSGKTMQDFKDFEHMLRELGLDKDTDIRNINYVARQQLEQGVRDKFNIEYDRQTQENANEEQENRTRRTNEDVETAKQGRQLAREEQTNRNRRTNEDVATSRQGRQIAREEQNNRNRASLDEHNIKTATLKQLEEDYTESVNEHNIANQRRLLEEGELRLKRILQLRGIKQAEFLNSLHINSDGTLTLDEKARIAIKDCWSYLMDVSPVGYLSDVLKDMLKK